MALILLVEVAIVQQRPQFALEKFAQAKAIIESISHGFILSRYRRLEAQLADYQADFIIHGNVEDLVYENHESALRSWLLKKALREDKSLARAARRLDVSKKTIYQWRKTYKIKA
jgi:transcriptional regulator with PAS, ATPase and Fis domain